MAADRAQYFDKSVFKNKQDDLFSFEFGAIVVGRSVPGIVLLAAEIAPVPAIHIKIRAFNAMSSAEAAFANFLTLLIGVANFFVPFHNYPPFFDNIRQTS